MATVFISKFSFKKFQVKSRKGPKIPLTIHCLYHGYKKEFQNIELFSCAWVMIFTMLIIKLVETIMVLMLALKIIITNYYLKQYLYTLLRLLFCLFSFAITITLFLIYTFDIITTVNILRKCRTTVSKDR